MVEYSNLQIKKAMELFQLGYQRQMQGEIHEAVNAYQHSIAIHPTAQAYTFLGWAFSAMGDLQRAICQCKRALEVDPDFPHAYNDIGAYLIEMGRCEEAVGWLEKAVCAGDEKSRPVSHYNLGRAYLCRGRINEAQDQLETALELQPDYHPAQFALEELKLRIN